jgi:hypothetical protein
VREISIDAIRDAATAVYRAAVRTPLVSVDIPGAPGGLDLYLKLEALQPIGSFKIRGAVNVVRQLTSQELADGVWTVSAGNAALGVAYAARQAGVPCSVIVVDTAPAAKVDASKRETVKEGRQPNVAARSRIVPRKHTDTTTGVSVPSAAEKPAVKHKSKTTASTHKTTTRTASKKSQKPKPLAKSN